MRQRLGLAMALLKDPDVLILDEPANGLDPAGMRPRRRRPLRQRTPTRGEQPRGRVPGPHRTTIARNTAAALGVGFAYFVVIENILGTALAGWRRWLLLGNLIVFLSGHSGTGVPGRSVLGAATFVTVVSLVLLAAGGAVFRRRDMA